MKKMIMLALLIVSQMSYAAGTARETKAMTIAEATTRIEANAEYRDLKNRIEKGEKLTTKDKGFIEKSLTAMLSGTGISSTGLQLLVEVRPQLMISIMEKASIILDKSSDAKKVEKAKTDLKISEAASKTVDVNSKDAKKDLDLVQKVTELSDYNKQTAEFRSEVIKQLEVAKSVEEAVKAAYKKVMGKELDIKNFEDCLA